VPNQTVIVHSDTWCRFDSLKYAAPNETGTAPWRQPLKVFTALDLLEPRLERAPATLCAAFPSSSVGGIIWYCHPLLAPQSRHLRQADAASAPTDKHHTGAEMRDQRSADIIRLHAVLCGKVLESHALASIDGGFEGSEVDLGAIGIHGSGHIVPFLNTHSIEQREV